MFAEIKKKLFSFTSILMFIVAAIWQPSIKSSAPIASNFTIFHTQQPQHNVYINSFYINIKEQSLNIA